MDPLESRNAGISQDFWILVRVTSPPTWLLSNINCLHAQRTTLEQTDCLSCNGGSSVQRCCQVICRGLACIDF